MNKLNTIDGETLMSRPLQPLNFVVDTLISQGLHILAGSLKVGKSWLALWLAVAVAKGEPVWGMQVKQGTTLYLCLEDSQLRIQNRLFDVTEDAPASVHFCTESRILGDGLTEQLEQFLSEHPDTSLIIIDTLQMIRGAVYDNTYANDYRDLSALKRLADTHEIAILLIHHLRKEKADDVFNRISGTTAISGAVDASFTLVEEQRGSGRAKLSCIGRDIEYRELELRRNADNVWEVTADSYQQPELLGSKVVVLLSALLQNRSQFIGTPTELAQRIDPVGTEGITPKNVSKKILQSVEALSNAGITAVIRRSNGKRLIDLRRADSADNAGTSVADPVDPATAAVTPRVGQQEARRELIPGQTERLPLGRKTHPWVGQACRPLRGHPQADKGGGLMATFTAIRNKKQTAGAMLGVLTYVVQAKKTVLDGACLVTGSNCVPQASYLEMMTTKQRFRKADGRQFYHFVQSFSEDDDLTPQEANAIGLELAQRAFPGYEVVIATHIDTAHLHNHLVVNSVSCENGRKLHQNRETLLAHRQLNDEICKAHGLQVLEAPEKYPKKKRMKPGEYQAGLRAESWKLDLIQAINEALEYAVDRESFIENMEYESYEVTWTDTRKHITFTCPNGRKCRDSSLHDETFLKENLEALFAYRRAVGFCPGSVEPDEGWIGELTSGLIQLGRAVERSDDLPPIPTPPTWTDSKQRRREAIKKMAMGQKFSGSQQWEQSM